MPQSNPQSSPNVRATTGGAAATPPRGVSIGQNGTIDYTEYAVRQLADAKQGSNETRANAVRMNAALPDDSWTVLDDAVYETRENTLQLVGDLMNAGLRTEIPLMAKLDQWTIVDDTGEASVDMDPETATAETSVSYQLDTAPVPIVHADYSMGFREGPAEESGRAVGDGVDAMKATTTSRFVNETIERLVLGAPGGGIGQQITVSRYDETSSLYGMIDHPATDTGATSADWTVDSTVVRDDVRAARSALKNEPNNTSPGSTGFWLYMGEDYWDVLDDADSEGDGNKTVRERVENLSNVTLQGELDYLPSKSFLMFRPTQDIIDLGVAAEVQTIQWENPFRDHAKVIGAINPRVKATASGQTGIAYRSA